MANFAQLNSENLVIQVLVVSEENCGMKNFPESEPIGTEYLRSVFGQDTNWAQTSYNGTFRYNYAGINYLFIEESQAFVAPKPYPEWLLNTNTFKWEPPVPYPSTGGPYWWDESTQTWVLFSK
jgi:hypothetical protein